MLIFHGFLGVTGVQGWLLVSRLKPIHHVYWALNWHVFLESYAVIGFQLLTLMDFKRILNQYLAEILRFGNTVTNGRRKSCLAVHLKRLIILRFLKIVLLPVLYILKLKVPRGYGLLDYLICASIIVRHDFRILHHERHCSFEMWFGVQVFFEVA